MRKGQTLYKHPLYNAATDFTPVMLIAEIPIVLETRKDLPVNNFKEFVAYAKANQAKMQFGSAGAGSATHLGCVLHGLHDRRQHHACSLSRHRTGVAGSRSRPDRLYVRHHYDGEAADRRRHRQGTGDLRHKRSPALPNVPTAAEQGTPNLVAYTWNAIFLPKNTPQPIVQALHDAVLAAMHTPAVRDRLTGLGAEVVPDNEATPQHLGNFVKSEIAKWAAPIKASGVSVQ